MRLLKAKGYEALAYSHPDDAFNEVKNDDFIILDYSIIRGAPEETIKKLSKTDENGFITTHIIILTGYPEEAEYLNNMPEVFRVLGKPIETKILINIIQQTESIKNLQKYINSYFDKSGVLLSIFTGMPLPVLLLDISYRV
ncbi:hypothetical protein [Candidatus Magnetomonas plexicatena]|uniref:hypothetical protein n=1 Tax=Candidatus Magnetomonas plexicatena TaxID=2552947 RepID=UPI001C784A27|nr:hypothetical protein E2O03_005795 [Nitrospirales bacterium LBB_01]